MWIECVGVCACAYGVGVGVVLNCRYRQRRFVFQFEGTKLPLGTADLVKGKKRST